MGGAESENMLTDRTPAIDEALRAIMDTLDATDLETREKFKVIELVQFELVRQVMNSYAPAPTSSA